MENGTLKIRNFLVLARLLGFLYKKNVYPITSEASPPRQQAHGLVTGIRPMGLLKAQILKYSPPLRIESKNTEFHFLTVLSKYSLIIVSTFNKTSFVPLSLYEQGTSNPLLFLFSRRPVTTAVIFPPEYNAYRQLLHRSLGT